MVQFAARPGYASPEQQNYWKLEPHNQKTLGDLRQEMRWRGIPYESYTSEQRLSVLLTRNDRGFLFYDACSRRELSSLCYRRGIVDNNKKRRGRKKTIKRLEREDEKATFKYFLMLPAELRNMIHLLHFATFGPLWLPAAPPLSSVSKQLRQETFRLFFENCTVEVLLPTDKYMPGHSKALWPAFCNPNTFGSSYVTRTLFNSWDEDISCSTLRLIAKAPKYVLNSLRRFTICGNVRTQSTTVPTVWTMTFSAQDQTFQVSEGQPLMGSRRSVLPDDYGETLKFIESGMRAALQPFAAESCSSEARMPNWKLLTRLLED